MKVIVGVVKYLGPLTPFIMLDSVEQRVLVSGKLELFQWRLFCGICFFCLDVGCRRVVLRYRVSGGESESVDVFPIVAKASLALAATSRERSFLNFTLATLEVRF